MYLGMYPTTHIRIHSIYRMEPSIFKAYVKQIQRFVYFFIRPRLTFDDENFAFVTFISYETFLREKIPKIEKKIMSKVRKKSSN